MGEPRECEQPHVVSTRCSPLLLFSLSLLLMYSASDPREYLKHVMKATNMSCLTPDGALSGECDFLSANMYARSLFGNFSIS
jgi:hypothetical protein